MLVVELGVAEALEEGHTPAAEEVDDAAVVDGWALDKRPAC